MHSKKLYKERIKHMNYKELLVEYNEVSKERMRIDSIRAQGGHPQGYGTAVEHHDPRMVQYKLAIITQKLQEVGSR